MSEPKIQVVDDNDQPIGGATLDEIYQKGLKHRIVRVVVEDGKGNILLQKRANTVSTYPGCWDQSAGGHVDEGESYKQAAERELLEELGFGGNLKEIGFYSTKRKINDKIMDRLNKVYHAIARQDFHFKFPEDEISEVKWLSIEEVKSLIEHSPNKVTDGLKDVLGRYYS